MASKAYIVGKRDSYGHYSIHEWRMVKVPCWVRDASGNIAMEMQERKELAHLFNVTDPKPYLNS